jgi:hypothetical protein
VIEVDHPSKLYSRGVFALRELSLTIDKGEFLFPSGLRLSGRVPGPLALRPASPSMVPGVCRVPGLPGRGLRGYAILTPVLARSYTW